MGFPRTEGEGAVAGFPAGPAWYCRTTRSACECVNVTSHSAAAIHGIQLRDGPRGGGKAGVGV